MSTENQLALVPHTYQGSLISQRDADGYINATAMCKAAGKEWNHYQANASTKAFLKALQGSPGISGNPVIQQILAGPNEQRGTWVHPQVAINLAQWLSPAFAVKVTEWVYEWMSGKKPSDKIWAQFEDRVSLVYDNVPLGYFCVFREIADLFASMIANGADFGTKMILDISVGSCWGNHWTASNLAAKYGKRASFPHNYPNYFPQAWSNPQDAKCYPDEAIPAFRKWMREVYVSHKMPAYLKSMVAQKKLAAPVANNALAALARREASRALPKAI